MPGGLDVLADRDRVVDVELDRPAYKVRRTFVANLPRRRPRGRTCARATGHSLAPARQKNWAFFLTVTSPESRSLSALDRPPGAARLPAAVTAVDRDAGMFQQGHRAARRVALRPALKYVRWLRRAVEPSGRERLGRPSRIARRTVCSWTLASQATSLTVSRGAAGGALIASALCGRTAS